MMSQHPDRVLFARSMDPKESLENFDPSEQVTLDFLGRGILQKWAAGFYQYEAGILDDEHGITGLPIATVFSRVRYGLPGGALKERHQCILGNF